LKGKVLIKADNMPQTVLKREITAACDPVTFLISILEVAKGSK